jgi:hypothetical protein
MIRPPNTNWGSLARTLATLLLTGGWWGLLAALAARWKPTHELHGLFVGLLALPGMAAVGVTLVIPLTAMVTAFRLRQASWSHWVYLNGEGAR